MQVIATQGSDGFMLLTSGRRDRLGDALVRIYDRALESISDEVPALSAAASGYWEPVADDVDRSEIIAGAETALAARG